MASFYQDVDEKVSNTMIDIKDFARYHVHKPRGNEKMYVYQTMMLNNEKYKDFEELVLKQHADENGKIICKKAAFLWIVYDDSREVIRYNKHGSKLRVVDPEKAKFWIREFEEKSIDELYEYGTNTISSAYGIVIDFFREWIIEQKYERIYSQSNDYEKWFELAEQNKDLIEGREVPFDIQMVKEKATTLINVRN